MMERVSRGSRGLAFVAVLSAILLSVSLGLVSVAPDTAQAAGKKTVVWVITKIKQKDSYGESSVTSYTYKKNGLVKAYKANGSAQTFSYDKRYRLKGGSQKYNGKVFGKNTYKLDKKGRVVKSVYKPTNGSSTSVDGKYKYNSKGQLVKSSGLVCDLTYKYTGKGLVSVRRILDGSAEEPAGKEKYTYDKKGNIATMVRTFDDEPGATTTTTTYTNTYKKGKLVKRAIVGENDWDNYTETIKYKKVAVPKSLAKMVKAQQQAILTGLFPIYTAHK